MIKVLVSALVWTPLLACAHAAPPIHAEVAPVFERGFDDDSGRRFYEVRFRLDRRGDPKRLGLPDDARVTDTGPELDACRDDRFFVHFPASAVPVAPHFDFARRLNRALNAQAWWFRGPESPDPRPARDQGWLRANRETQCHVVDALRQAAAEAHDVRPSRVRVGRVCEFTGQVLREAIDRNAVWHLDALDPRGVPELPELPDRGRPNAVDLHLLDSGYTGRLDVERHPMADLFGDEAQPLGPPTDHGQFMVHLVHQLVGRSPDVNLHMWRVLDEFGKGTPHDLARALEAINHHVGALDPNGRFPQVLNLSLGWPSDFGQDRLLWTTVDGGSVPACGSVNDRRSWVVESAVGEAVRHALARLADHNDEGQPVVAFAAAGNMYGRPEIVDAATEAQLATVPMPDGCVPAGDDWRSAWFFPAEWGFVPTTCLAGEARDFAVVPVGAVDALGDPARMARADAEPAFAAPGEQVVIWSDDGPVAMSGTSLATALYSAAAARLQVLMFEAQASPMRAWDLVRHLYLTARPLGSNRAPRPSRNPTGVPAQVRMLNTCRAEEALACQTAACPQRWCSGDAEACAGSPVDCVAGAALPGVMASDAVVDACTTCLEACMAEAEVACMAPLWAPTWSEAGYAAFDALRFVEVGVASATDSTSGKPFEEGVLGAFEVDERGEVVPGPYALGALGPQPLQPPCPSCGTSVVFDGGAAQMSAWLQINPKLNGVVRAAWVVVRGTDGAMAWSKLAVPAGGWKAGTYYKATGIEFDHSSGFSQPLIWGKAKVALWAHIEVASGKGGGSTYADASPLYVTLP